MNTPAVDLAFETLTLWLRWDRVAILDGQLWRLVTAGLVHLSWQHAFSNIVGAALWWRLEGLARLALPHRQRLLAVPVGATIVHVALLFATTYDWYAGASATLYGLFAFTALRSGWRGMVMLLALLTWLVVGAHLVNYAFPVAYQAHWVGVAAGMAAGATALIRNRHTATFS